MDPKKRITSEHAMQDPYFSEDPKVCQEYVHISVHHAWHVYSLWSVYIHVYVHNIFSCSVFDAMNIPYPARKFLSDDDNKDDKGDKVSYFTA